MANQFISPTKGGQFVVTQKGTGKVLSHHASKEMAQKSFAAMMASKHAANNVKKKYSG